ncbi:MAG: aminodeoxychorismate synthase component I [Endozoicomonas sp.]
MKELTILNLDYQADSSDYFERFCDQPWASFLDSCADSFNEQHSRYDIITSDPWAVVTVDGSGSITVNNRKTGQSTHHNGVSPFKVLSNLLSQMSEVQDTGLPFTGGALGYWGYELASLMEPAKIQPREMNTPLMSVGLYHWALISDHASQCTQLVFHPDMPASDRERILALLDQTPDRKQHTFRLRHKFSGTITADEYRVAFSKIQDYILAGDCYEVNLTQEFTSSFEGDSWAAYKKLRSISPAPYSAYLCYPDLQVLSHSPERFIRITDRHVETHPIKGTRPRGATPGEDKRNSEELLASEKDQAENLMIVDLLRNDLGKICKTGSIKVPRLFGLESYANVHHLVSTVTGELDKDHNVFDVMASAFPGGSITGAPKIRSMQIIRELETSARNVYCGAVGYISCNGHMDTSITIRTMVAYDNRLHCWGGGAIVADSDCEQEYQESVTKVRNLMSALEEFAV